MHNFHGIATLALIHTVTFTVTGYIGRKSLINNPALVVTLVYFSGIQFKSLKEISMRPWFLKEIISPLLFARRTNGQLLIQLIDFLKSSFWNLINIQFVRKPRIVSKSELFRVVNRNVPNSITHHNIL